MTPKQAIEKIRYDLARPYVLASVRENTQSLLKRFRGDRKLDSERIINRVQALTYAKPWPENVSPDDAFNLAIHEALIIIREELK
jgi:hypothetical protein